MKIAINRIKRDTNNARQHTQKKYRWVEYNIYINVVNISPWHTGLLLHCSCLALLYLLCPRNDKLKIWQHIQGQVATMTHLDSHYYGCQTRRDVHPGQDANTESTILAKGPQPFTTLSTVLLPEK